MTKPNAVSLETHWLFMVPGLAMGDPRRVSTAVRVFIVMTAYVSGLVALTVLWSIAFDFWTLLESGTTMRFFVPLILEALTMALGIYWAATVLPIELGPGLDCYQDQERVRTECARVLRRLLGARWAVIGALIGSGLVVTALVRTVAGAESSSLIFSGLDPRWFEAPLLPKALVALIWAALLGALAVVGTHGVVTLWSLFVRLSSGELLDRPAYVLPRLRHIVLFSQFVALGWSCYLLIFYIATFRSLGSFSAAFVAAATVVLIVAFLLPHIALHLSLRRMAGRITAQIRADADLALSADPPPMQRMQILSQLSTEPAITWLYDLRIVATFLAVGPLASAAVGFLGALLPN